MIKAPPNLPRGEAFILYDTIMYYRTEASPRGRFGGALLFALFLQCLFDVSQDVVDILDADGEADEVGCYAGFTQLFVA